jgi:hypothetical protein
MGIAAKRRRDPFRAATLDVMAAIVPAWRRLVGAYLLFVIASFTSVTSLGCGSAPTFPRSAATAAIERVLGGAPELVVTGHVAAALRDPLWESSKPAFFEDIDRLTRSPEAKRALASIDRVELYVRLSSPTRTVAIFRDVPSALTPEVLTSKDGSPAYGSGRTLSSSVREYAPHPGERGHVFVLPNRDWVVADEVSAPLVGAALASDAPSSAFPPPDLGLDRTAVAYLSASFFEHAARAGWFSPPTPIEGVVVGVGNDRKVEAYVKYATEAMARKSEGESGDLLRSRLGGAKVKVSRDGAVLSAIFTLPDMSRSLGESAPSPSPPAAVPPPHVATPAPPSAPRFVPGPLPAAFSCDGPIQRLSAPAPPPHSPPPAPLRPSRPSRPGHPRKPGRPSAPPSAPELDLDESATGVRTKPAEGPPPVAGQMTEGAAMAKRSFDSERWDDALRAFESVVDGTTGDDEGNRHIAQYKRAIALFKLRRFPESAAVFREIAGSTRHLKHAETLLWLVQFTAAQPEALRVTDFATYTVADVSRYDNPGQQDVYITAAFLVGRHRLAIGANGEAQELLSRVPTAHPYGAEARKCAAAR